MEVILGDDKLEMNSEEEDYECSYTITIEQAAYTIVQADAIKEPFQDHFPNGIKVRKSIEKSPRF